MSRKLMRVVLAMMAIVLFAGSAYALKPAVIYDMGGKNDKSFNQAAYNGVVEFNKETGVKYLDFEPTNETQYEQAMRRFARKGHDIIVVVGFSFASPLAKVAKDFPNTKFVIIDSVVDAPNVQSVTFKEHEGSYLVGMIAAMKSKTGKIGFIGGMDIPLIRNFAWGYEQGIKSVNPKAEFYKNYVGTTPAAWADPIKGGELANSQFDRGADVVFAAAGGSGMGVLQASADKNKYSIGVDSNQNYLFPGNVLTSMVKRVDRAVFETLMAANKGTWKAGHLELGLADEGVDYALDKYNESLIDADMRAKVEKARDKIMSGKVKVTSYYEIEKN